MSNHKDESKEDPFFVGYLKVPAGLGRFLLTACIVFVAGFAGAGLLLGATQDDPGAAGFRFDYGRQTVTGVVELKPYPLLRVLQGSEQIKAGRTIMMTGQGKSGIMARAGQLDGKMATASGVVLKRGDLDMLQLRGGKNGLSAAGGTAPAVATRQLGRWKMAGEICDGKCLAGAMNPGRGLAHKACANLCLLGGIPPVFVSSQKVEGSEFFLVADLEGDEMPQEAYDHVGQFIEVEGDLESRGDMMVFKIDPSTIRVLP